MCTTKVPVLVKARVRKKYMLVGKIAERVGKIAPAAEKRAESDWPITMPLALTTSNSTLDDRNNMTML